VAIELARRGLEVVGVDLDPAMIDAARAKAPELDWRQADLAEVDLRRAFDAVVLAGNVLIFVVSGSEQAVLENMGRHLRRGGLCISGFGLRPGGLRPERLDELCATAGLDLVDRFATWGRDPYTEGGAYAVSVHRRR
jgi:SAM-dependent methyltransferase